MRYYKTLVLLLLCLATSSTYSQDLDRIVSIAYKDQTLEYVIDNLQKVYNLNISYSSNQIPLQKKCSINIANVPLKVLLDEVCKQLELSYQIVGKNIVLIKASAKPITQPIPKKTSYQMQEVEYLTANTKASYETASIDRIQLQKEYLVEKKKLLEVYEVKVDSLKNAQAHLTVRELKLQIKLIMMELKNELKAIRNKAKNANSIFLTKNSTNTIADSAYAEPPLSNSNMIDSNVKIGDWQITFVPPISSNGRDAGKYINKISLNVIGGYAYGLKGIEVGSIANIEKNNVDGAQYAGVGNFVKGNAGGIQCAGVVNVVGKNVVGTQFAGTTNIAGGYLRGAQFAGILNVAADSSDGFQAAGIANIVNGNIFGTQLAGIVNAENGNMVGFQGVGIANIVRGQLYGAQLAGIANYVSDSLRGTQVAGIINVAQKEISGLQISAIINVAKHIRGTQIGLLNIADSVTGTQIGLLSIARNGYKKLEIFGSEALYGNVAFKMGMPRFYNIFAIGVRPEDGNFIWSVGYGVGTDFTLSNRTNLNIDLVCNQLNENDFWTKDLNLLNQLKINFSFLIGNRTRLFVGPVLNYKVSKLVKDNTNEIGSQMVSWNIYDKIISGTRVMMWPGLHAGIRF